MRETGKAEKEEAADGRTVMGMLRVAKMLAPAVPGRGEQQPERPIRPREWAFCDLHRGMLLCPLAIAAAAA